MKSKISIAIIILVFCTSLQAKIKVASVLGDNMVLQRNTEVKLWGTANPNQKLTIATSWNKAKINTAADTEGKWLIKAKTTEAGGPYEIIITSGNEKVILKNILLGEVWLCSGQSNMEMPVLGFNDQPVNGSNEVLVNADNTNLRFYTVKRKSINLPQDTCVGKWEVASAQSVGWFSAVGYFFASSLQKALNVPVGVINSSWGGSRIEAWMDSVTLQKFPESFKNTTKEKTNPNQRATFLYNGMISPIKNYSIKGVLWYQGESNRGEFQYYAALQKAMVDKWKSDFELSEMPFYFVQIAPYNYNNSKNILSGKFYDEQYKASLQIPNAGMVATVDIGEEFCIHPAEKKTVGQRLTYWALSETYKKQGIAYKNPVYKSVEVKDSSLVVSFDNSALGLSSFGKELNNFEIAGEDKVFYPATARIKSKQVILTAFKVKKPVSARYCYMNFPSGNGFLYNTAGLPVLPFRTDNW